MKNVDIDKLLQEIFNDNSKLDVKALFEQKTEEYGITKTRALKLLSIDKDVFEDIIEGKAKQPNLIHVVKIAEFLGIALDEFIQVVLKNQNSENIASIDRARKVKFVMQNFDVKALTKLGFFERDDDIEDLTNKVLRYFGYNSIREFEEELNVPLFSRSKRQFSDKMKDFWVRSAYQTFKLIDNPNPYDRNQLKEVVGKLKPYSQDINNGLYTVCRALYNIGVTVIFQNYLSTTHVRGATFIINDKPCIVLTDYMKSFPTIWFTLLHELHHVLFDYEAIKTNKFHLSDDQDLFLIEEKADSFARDYFLPKSSYDYIKTFINNKYMVERFARENEIHASLVYSFYAWYQDKLHDKKHYGKFNKHFPDLKPAIAKLNPITWDEDSVRLASEKIKAVFEIN